MANPSKEDIKLGYDFEDELKNIFKELIATYPIFWHQFVDTKAARNYVAAQPADFLFTSAGQQVYLLEAKASTLKPSLAVCAKSHIRPSQIGMAKKWIRAGRPSLFVFYCEADSRVEFWDGEYVTKCISDGVKLKESMVMFDCDYFDLKKVFINKFCF